ncbi:hypothetical protein EBB79_08850 [Parasedimentitalea marina]|uniref:J domain-containing protein n=1 Tax=Parasedimentitalea marina TaxID=2483033 RepID=A0A3T0N1X8_9RHOB|nr:hypothetical protein [Parasedimentitalea marina]AZV77992.1 hypothetical protein EBB79_08850 [Parasedimentitalea marina]
MSDKTDWPFNALGLEGKDPDKKEVRKAYAKALKAIDQRADPQGFQTLRQTYETALALIDAPKFDDWTKEDTPADSGSLWPIDESALVDDVITDAEGLAQESLSPAAITLIEQVSTFTPPEPDVERLLSILEDPLMTDPVVAQAVENEMYSFLFSIIDDENEDYPSFALRGMSGSARNPSVSNRLPEFVDRLDETFGWMSDQVRMQNRFYGYDRFFFAASYLGSRRMSQAPQASSSSGINWGVVWPIIFFGALFLMNVVPEAFEPKSQVSRHRFKPLSKPTNPFFSPLVR